MSRRYSFSFGVLKNYLLSLAQKVRFSGFHSFVFNKRPARRGDGLRDQLAFASCRAAKHRRGNFRIVDSFVQSADRLRFY